ncbi:MAG TPA: hypothetical protein VFK32_06200 [Tepidiformaceae bacterium]|nr:hypothetical protein [Tepidiformaceae bacterium]
MPDLASFSYTTKEVTQMAQKTIRRLAGTCAIAGGVVLIGTSGFAFVAGWGLWAAGLAVLLPAVQTAETSVQRGVPVVKSV